jgi:pimeloyl-ACP methyl ester carboxylesterase
VIRWTSANASPGWPEDGSVAISRKTSTMSILALASGLFLLALLALGIWLWTPDRDRAQLEATYLSTPGDMRQVGPWRLHLRDTGPRDAQAVLFIHGFGSSLHTWEAWALALESMHRIVRFDLPGNGLSDPDPTGDYSDERSHQLIVAVMDSLGLAKAGIAGHSIGGRLAWTFAARHPQRVERLVLVAPDGFASPGFAYGRAAEVPASMALMRYALPKPLLKMSLAPAYADPSVMTPALMTRYHEMMLAPGARQAMLARMRQTVLTDPVPQLRAIVVPTLLIWGEQDAMIPFANSSDYLRTLPNARLAAIPGVGHLPQEERAAEGLRALSGFLQATQAGLKTAP